MAIGKRKRSRAEAVGLREAGQRLAAAAPNHVPATTPASRDADGDNPHDRLLRSWLSGATGGLSPAALAKAFSDWAIHLSSAPNHRVHLMQAALRSAWELASELAGGVKASAPADGTKPDPRFADEGWRTWPFSAYASGFLAITRWWDVAARGLRGMDERHEQIVRFTIRQLLDAVSPSNCPATNPEVLAATFKEGGHNLWRGWRNWTEDIHRRSLGRPSSEAAAFVVGRDVAATPGKVVYRNRLVELIQYASTKAQVRAEPILIVPAWIMKYYILDLSPANSLVRYLVDNGHTVFMVSWKNPDADDRDLGMEEYLRLGLYEPIDAIRAILPDAKCHAVGYCLGGTLLAIGAAALARDGRDFLKTVNLFAAQTDFTEAGELMLFINSSQLAFLEDIMWERGFLDPKQMAGAFQLLRSNDLVWSTMVHDYLLGQRRPLSDLMAWNSDATRMPYRMHSEYLRKLFLQNDLAEGRFRVGGKPISLTDVRVPIFAVSTLSDHVAPWRSVYKIKMLTNADVTFVLSNGGHNAGIVSEPGHPNRFHQIATTPDDHSYVDPDAWQARAEWMEGSWWPCWQEWLAVRSTGPVRPPGLGAPTKGYPVLDDAPGGYVRVQ